MADRSMFSGDVQLVESPIGKPRARLSPNTCVADAREGWNYERDSPLRDSPTN